MQSITSRVMRAVTAQPASIHSSLLSPSVLALSSSSSHPLSFVRSYHQKGRHQVMNRSFNGIFAGRHIGFGNMVSHSERKTRRSWSPNAHLKQLHSEVLNEKFYLEVTTTAIRCFDKFGGLDRYLLRTPLHRLDEGITRELRTDMELKLLDNPALARDLHLEDVLERLQRPSEVKRLRRIVVERAEEVRAEGQLDHPWALQRIPDGTIPVIQELTAEEQARAQQAKEEYEAAKAARKKALADARAEAAVKGVPILAPASVVSATAAPRAPRGERTPHLRRASYQHPFTAPIPKDIPRTHWQPQSTELPQPAVAEASENKQ